MMSARWLLIIVAMVTGNLRPMMCACLLGNDRTLDLRSNLASSSVTRTTLPQCQGHLSNTTGLDLSFNNITSVANDSFSSFYNLRKLDLSHNQIRWLDVNTFTSLRKLEELDITHNLLTELCAGLLDVASLRSVLFDHNKISYVEPGIVSDMNVALQFFNMTYNRLMSLDPWPYLVYQPHTNEIHKTFDVQHNEIRELTNNMSWAFDLQFPYEVSVNLQYNDIQAVTEHSLTQYKDVGAGGEFSMISTMDLNLTHNKFHCDCNVFRIANLMHTSVLRYISVESYRYICATPVHLAGWDFLHDIDLEELVCNVTESAGCPHGCACQDRPHNDTFYINCTGASLTTFPQTIPDHDARRIELVLDDNMISEMVNTTYLDIVYSISLRNNHIQTLSADYLNELQARKLDLRGNRLTNVPVQVKKFESIQLTGNPLQCDCDSMWMREWMEIDANNADHTLTCTPTASAGSKVIIVEMTLRELGCTSETLIAISACLAFVIGLLIVALVFYYRCRYETMVILHRLFNIHPSDKYKVDKDRDKDVDIYIVFDDRDTDVIGYVRYFLNRLNKKRPCYSILNPARFMVPGCEYENIVKYIGQSRRVLVFLSKGIFHNRWRLLEIEDAERRQVETQQAKEGKAKRAKGRNKVTCSEEAHASSHGNFTTLDMKSDREDATNSRPTSMEKSLFDNPKRNAANLEVTSIDVIDVGEVAAAGETVARVAADDTGSDTPDCISPKIIYMIFNDDPALCEELNSDLWRVRLQGRCVLRLDDENRWFWSKLRYELPQKGNGSSDGNYLPFKHVPAEPKTARTEMAGVRVRNSRFREKNQDRRKGKGASRKSDKTGQNVNKQRKDLTESFRVLYKHRRGVPKSEVSTLDNQPPETGNGTKANKAQSDNVMTVLNKSLGLAASATPSLANTGRLHIATGVSHMGPALVAGADSSGSDDGRVRFVRQTDEFSIELDGDDGGFYV